MSFARSLARKAKSIFSSKAARREMLIDAFIIAPYVVTDTLLYYASFLNFLGHAASDQEHPEEASWYAPAFYIGTTIISAILAPALFLAFSNLVNNMLKTEDNEYRELKYHARRVLGMPGSLTKVFAGDSSLYFFMGKIMNKAAAISIGCIAGALALPALASFLWSNNHKLIDGDSLANLTSRQKNLLRAKYAAALITSTAYSTDVGFAYLYSALNLPKNMELMNHDLSQYQNKAELAGFLIICIFAIIETIAVLIAFSRLNANMFGLINDNENPNKGCWARIENSWIKKSIGGFATVFKVINTAASAFHFFKNKMPLGVNIAFDAYSSMGGLICQTSLLICDPLASPKQRTIITPEPNIVEAQVPQQSNIPTSEITNDDSAYQSKSLTLFSYDKYKTNSPSQVAIPKIELR